MHQFQFFEIQQHEFVSHFFSTMIISGSAALFIMLSGVGASGFMATTSSNKKNAKGAPEKKESPKRKDINKISFSPEDLKKRRKPSYYLKIVKLRPDYELIFIDSTPGTDGYGQRLFDHINNNNGFRDHGILMVLVAALVKTTIPFCRTSVMGTRVVQLSVLLTRRLTNRVFWF
jgi:hypothetical protein